MYIQLTGFWVAEAFETYPQRKDPSHLRYLIINESQLQDISGQDRFFIKKIVGTIAVNQSRQEMDSAWLRRMAVTSKYQRKGVGTALLNEALKFCQRRGQLIFCFELLIWQH